MVQIALWCSDIPLPHVRHTSLLERISVCSITRSEPRPAQYWRMRLITWNPGGGSNSDGDTSSRRVVVVIVVEVVVVIVMVITVVDG